MSLLDTASLIVTPNGYKEGKLYSVIPSDGSGDMSVTRATTATRVNSAGLVELVPYNLIWYSEQFDNSSYWGYEQISVTANSTTAPNGTLTADTITDSSTFGYAYQSVPLSGGVGSIVTNSVFLKRTNNDWVNVAASRTPGTTYGEFGAWFNLATGAIGSNFQAGAGIVIDKQITDEGDGWYRCSVTGYVPNAVGYVPYVFNSNADNSFTSSAGKSHYQWGAQLVEGSTALPYQKTETRLNIPRLDYSNGTCPSLLVEPQRTNVLTYSSSFDSVDWNKTNCSITANNTTAPDGTTTADKLILANGQSGSSSDGTGIRQFVDIASGSYTYSIYAKAAEFTTIRFRENQVTGAFLTIDLTNGAITNGDVSQYINPTATLVSNGWYRITFQTPTLTALYKYSVRVSETGNGTSGIFIWGYQVELGSYPTSYIPTTSASVTRNADVISKTGISSLIGQTEGTLFWDVDFEVVANNDAIFIKENATFDTFVFMQKESSGVIACGYYGSGALQARIESSPVTVGRYKIAFAYKNNDFVMYLNGTQVGTDTSGTVSGLMDYFDLHWTESGCNNAYASALWKTRLTNTQLAQLTTI